MMTAAGSDARQCSLLDGGRMGGAAGNAANLCGVGAGGRCGTPNAIQRGAHAPRLSLCAVHPNRPGEHLRLPASSAGLWGRAGGQGRALYQSNVNEIAVPQPGLTG